MLQDAEFDRYHLPPLTRTSLPTPRPLTSQPTPRPLTSQGQPSYLRLSSRVSQWPTTAREERPHKSLKTVSRGHREWTTGLCGCGEDKKMCFLTVFCPCIVTWNMAANLGETCCMPLLPGNCVAVRTKTRTLGGIKGSICKDWFASCCCPCCALTQTARELDTMAIQTDKLIRPIPE